MTVTIYDVAREANVSMATVSRVVNGNQNVKPATRIKAHKEEGNQDLQKIEIQQRYYLIRRMEQRQSYSQQKE